MSIKQILVSLDSQRNLGVTAQAACDTAAAHGAHVTGFYVIPRVSIPTYAESRIPEEVIRAHDEAARRDADAAGKAFNSIANAAGCSHDWLAVKGHPESLIIDRARYSDIVIMGQARASKPSPHSVAVENSVIMGCARPVVMIPKDGVPGKLGERIVVAWNGSREAVRAINDAMPLLETAAGVSVLTIDPGEGGGDVPGAEICQHLARHDIPADAVTVKSKNSTTETLLAHARENGANLVVMGAYGHSRLREFVLGGATYNMLQYADVAVLLSH